MRVDERAQRAGRGVAREVGERGLGLLAPGEPRQRGGVHEARLPAAAGRHRSAREPLGEGQVVQAERRPRGAQGERRVGLEVRVEQQDGAGDRVGVAVEPGGEQAAEPAGPQRAERRPAHLAVQRVREPDDRALRAGLGLHQGARLRLLDGVRGDEPADRADSARPPRACRARAAPRG